MAKHFVRGLREPQPGNQTRDLVRCAAICVLAPDLIGPLSRYEN